MGLFSTTARTEFTAEDRADQTALGLCEPDPRATGGGQVFSFGILLFVFWFVRLLFLEEEEEEFW